MADLAVRPVSPRVAEQVRVALFALKAHFTEYIDRGWLAMIIDTLPIDRMVLRQVREMFTHTGVYDEDIPELRAGVRRLERFCGEIRRHLLPELRERLGVSGLLHPVAQRSGTDRVQRQLLCVTFPGNLETLERLTEAFHDALDRID